MSGMQTLKNDLIIVLMYSGRWEREHQRLLDEERELFANDPNWVVGRNVYHTMPQPK